MMNVARSDILGNPAVEPANGLGDLLLQKVLGLFAFLAREDLAEPSLDLEVVLHGSFLDLPLDDPLGRGREAGLPVLVLVKEPHSALHGHAADLYHLARGELPSGRAGG